MENNFKLKLNSDIQYLYLSHDGCSCACWQTNIFQKISSKHINTQRNNLGADRVTTALLDKEDYLYCGGPGQPRFSLCEYILICENVQSFAKVYV